MIRKLENSHDNVIGYSVAGDVSEEEYRRTASDLRDQIALHGKVRLLFRVSDISPQSFVTAWLEGSHRGRRCTTTAGRDRSRSTLAASRPHSRVAR